MPCIPADQPDAEKGPIREEFRPVKHTARALVSKYYATVLKGQRAKYVFILGHMRSGSSLLTHILASSDEVRGYGETHLTYHHRKDLRLLKAKVLFTLRAVWPDKTEGYYLDKILHSMHFSLTESNFAYASNMRFIYFLRDPEPTVLSMIKTFGYTQDEACSYYIGRLETIRREAEIIPDKTRFLFFTHAQLLGETDAVLGSLRNFLGLKKPLSQEYEVLRTTGKPVVGDPSEAIKTGRILRTDPNAGADAGLHVGMLVQNDLLGRAKAVYASTCAELQNVCSTVAASEQLASADEDPNGA